MVHTERYFSAAFDRSAFETARRLRDHPGKNAYAERLIGSIRRECLDHIVVFGGRHLRHVLLSYTDYYNGTRTHLSLDKDAPISRAAEVVGRILSGPILGGLHQKYVRV
jgi:transposase InsO family protein